MKKLHQILLILLIVILLLTLVITVVIIYIDQDASEPCLLEKDNIKACNNREVELIGDIEFCSAPLFDDEIAGCFKNQDFNFNYTSSKVISCSENVKIFARLVYHPGEANCQSGLKCISEGYHLKILNWECL